jgi:ribonuclease E
LVSIDINSGRSTREHNIEQTAYNTNLEAAQEIARQLRLRDMAGLVVIDFIDMEQSSHVRKVEKAMKDALKNDRARIQVGRISSFGLMEMSRQRLRTGVLEASTKPCPHCDGTGLMRTAASAGLSALRMIEDEATRGRGEKIMLRAGREAAVYVLNKKRAELADVEHRYGVSIEIVIDESFEGARMTVESSGPRPTAAPRVEQVLAEDPEDEEEILEDDEDEVESDEEEEDTVQISLEREPGDEAGAEDDRPGRRRRRRRRGGRGRGRREEGAEPSADDSGEGGQEPPPAPQVQEAAEETPSEPSRRRRRRGGRKASETASAETPVEPDSSPMVERPIDEEPPIALTEAADEPKPKGRGRRKAVKVAEVEVTEPAPAEAPAAATAEEPAAPAKPARKRRGKAAPTVATDDDEGPESTAVPVPNNDTSFDELGEPRRGWWQRTFG